jgi:putative flippase GtrA
MHDLVKKHAEKIRFGMVGIANTALDFVILFALTAFGFDKIAANYVSTTVAFVFSFFINRSFTFKSKNKNIRRQFILFVTVTLVGLWAIQPIVIAGVSWLLAGSALAEPVVLFIAKVIATVASLIWNYLFYSRLVFKSSSERS